MSQPNLFLEGTIDPSSNQLTLVNDEFLPEKSIFRNTHIYSGALPPPWLLHKGMKAIQDQAVEDVAELNVKEFIYKWAPLFNYTSHENIEDIPIMDWVEVSGSPYKEVKLVDDFGNEVVRVPPLLGLCGEKLYVDTMDSARNSAAVSSISVDDRQAKELVVEAFCRGLAPHSTDISENFIRMNKVFEVLGLKRNYPDWIKRKLIEQGVTNNQTSPSDLKVHGESKSKVVANSIGMIEED